ncbi:MAG: phosphoenolpyruvate--protein phosphotransferase [Suipraeoptans sp.]
MKIIEGKSICKKMAIGKIFFYDKGSTMVKREKIEDVSAEIERVEKAKKIAIEQLGAIYEKAKHEIGEAEAAVFEVHQMMLEDGDYGDSINNIIETQKVCAEFAVANTSENFSRMFSEMDDEYMKARAADIKDISERLIDVLSGTNVGMDSFEEPVIVVANDLAPSETVSMDKSKLLGFVTQWGSMNSHTAILARTMNIPALINVEIDRDWDGKLAIIDGYEGKIIIDPDDKMLEIAQSKLDKELDKERLLKELRGQETVTRSGSKIKLYANIGSVADTATALQNDAEGIGLFRSEFLYLESKDFPTEDEQFVAYKAVAENMAGKKVIIRTLDIGADKQVDYFNLKKEENPALGYRAIRICLHEPEIFRTQLRAIMRASAYGNIAIMFPMIIEVEELLKAKEYLAEVKRELIGEGIPYGDIEVGVMIETPASVMISRELAKEVDFFSIGTNDLTQYTLAVDRQNPMLDEMINPHHPAILAMIKMTIENGHEEGIWVGICGELGADTSLTKTFIEYGVDELSVSAGKILEIREEIRGLD